MNLNNNNIRLNEQRRHQQEAEADYYRFTHQNAQPRYTQLRISHSSARYLLIALFILTIVLLNAYGAQAQDLTSTGDLEPFAEAMSAYRVGHYFFIKGNYEQAVEQYNQTINDIPQVIFEASADYAMIYWDMGEAQFMAGQNSEALVSYQNYLELVASEASEDAVAYVQQLESSILNNTVGEMTLISEESPA